MNNTTGDNTTRSLMMKSTEDIIADAIQRSYMWVLCAVGVPANTLAIIIILAMQRMTPATLLIAALALFDGSALVSKLVFMQMNFNQIRNEATCKLNFIAVFFSTMANWTLVYICLERCIAVCYPLKKLYLVTITKCCVLLIVTTALFLSYYISVDVITIKYDVNKKACDYVSYYEKFRKNYHVWIRESCVLLIPYVTVVTLTVISTVKLKFYAKRRRETLQSTSTSDSISNQNVIRINERSENVLTVMLTVIAIFFLLFTLPSFSYFLYSFVGKWNRLFIQIKFVLFDATHALNFFMYFLTASRFRQRCYQMLGCSKLVRLTQRRKSTKSDETDEEMSPTTQLTSIKLNGLTKKCLRQHSLQTSKTDWTDEEMSPSTQLTHIKN